MSRGPLAIGCAAGFGGDRTDAAGPVVDTLIARGGPGVLIFEVLAERTLALAQLERRADPDRGYAPLMEPMLRPVLGRCLDHGIPIVSNFGAANPRAAARRIRRIARERGRLRRCGWRSWRATTCPTPAAARSCASTSPPSDATRELVSANAYLGAAAIAEALRAGARWWSPGAWPTRRWRSGRRWPTSAGRETDWDGSPAPPSPGT